MKTKTKKLLSILLSAALVTGLFAAMPLAASAGSVTGDYILFLHTDGKLRKNNGSGEDITAAMSAAGATVSGSAGQWVLTLNNFSFETTANYALKATTGTTIILTGDNTITSSWHGMGITSDSGSITITSSSAGRLNAFGGDKVGSASNGIDIVNTSTTYVGSGASLTIDGNATVNATGGNATDSDGIHVGDRSSLTITGSATVNATGGSAERSSRGIRAVSYASITISGSATVNAVGGSSASNYGSIGLDTKSTGCTLTISDNAVVKAAGTSAGGIANYGISYNNSIELSGGEVTAIGNSGAFTTTYTVPSGYTYWTNTTATETGASGPFTGDGSTTTVAYLKDRYARIEVSGKIPPVITAHPQPQTIVPGGTANFSVTATGVTSYQWQYSEDNGSTWKVFENNQNYSNVTTANLTFKEVDDAWNGRLIRCLLNDIYPTDSAILTITVSPANAPTIIGPSAMPLKEGYAATSSGAFTITGDPAPTVTKTLGDAKITWNDASKKLDIAAGLAEGVYPVTLKATNGNAPDATLNFTLTVTAGEEPPEDEPPDTPPTPAPFPFTDVPQSAWYYYDVKNAYEMGLINGKTATLFAPNDNLTYAEAVKLAACMHQKYTTGSVTLANASPIWYQSFVDYAKANSIIIKDYNWSAQATRAGYMEMFAYALPDSALAAFNSVPDGSIPDVPMTHPQAAAIYKLYRAGILQGVDTATHSCNPGSNIRRSEVAAILTRMMDPTERVSFGM